MSTRMRTETTSGMSVRTDRLFGATVRTSDDEEFGTIVDFLFDDESWQTRYMVVETGPWLFGRKLLVSPYAMETPISPASDISVGMTKQQAEESPEIDVDKPVSMQQEKSLHDFYSWPYYWAAMPAATGTGVMGAVPAAPGAAMASGVRTDAPDEMRDAVMSAEATEEIGDPNLRSMKEVMGYNIHATDDEVGHVEDFFVDSNTLKINFMLVDTRNWLPGRDVLISPEWIDRVSWQDSNVYVEVTRDQIESSPEYNPADPVTRDEAVELFKHYGYPYTMI